MFLARSGFSYMLYQLIISGISLLILILTGAGAANHFKQPGFHKSWKLAAGEAADIEKNTVNLQITLNE